MRLNQTQINQLKEITYKTLDPLIDKDYCLLDVPDHSNIGDSLIYAGELDYLMRLPHKQLYSCNITRCRMDRIPNKAVLLLHGGGNFGDLYRAHQYFRSRIIERFKANRIIMFPQTAHYGNAKNLEIDAAIYNEHPDLTLCARDEKSYNLFKKHFYKNNVLLLPDMAFCINMDAIETSTGIGSNKTLLLKRTDKELNANFDLTNLIKNKDHIDVDVKDWPTYRKTFAKRVIYKVDSFATKFLLDVPILNRLVDPRYGIKGGKIYNKYNSAGIRFINSYDEIYSTRLHGTILSILLGKKVHMLDNSYGKNSGFYKAWLIDFDHVSLISQEQEL